MTRPSAWAVSFGLALACFVAGCLCPQGQLSCDGQCVDPRASDPHCGACGQSCGAGFRCEDATCVRLPECGPRAASPVECDDDDLCNGVFECHNGFCERIIPAANCDDGLECTRSSCDPTDGRCFHVPEDDLCNPGFTCNPDSGCREICTYEPCTVATQCGCASGETCVPAGIGGACRSAGAGAEGSGCTRNDQCGAGLLCYQFGTGDPGTCSRPCHDAEDCGGDLCFVQAGYETLLPNGDRYGRCEQTCDPVDSGGCASTQICLVFGSGARIGTVCAPQGTVRTGSTCIDDYQCVRNNICVRYSSRMACGRLCHTNSDCPSGTCYDFDTPLVVHSERVGVCG